MNDLSRTSSEPRSLSRSSSRSALLIAARTCVRTHGLTKTTSRLIASTADVNLGSITYYFGSKDELIAEALFGELSKRLEPAMEILNQDNPASDRLLTAVQALIAELENSVEDIPVYLNALILSGDEGTLAHRARELLTSLSERLALVISQLQKDNAIAHWVNPNAMASLLIATANGIALHTHVQPNGPSAAQLASQLAGLLLASSTDIS